MSAQKGEEMFRNAMEYVFEEGWRHWYMWLVYGLITWAGLALLAWGIPPIWPVLTVIELGALVIWRLVTIKNWIEDIQFNRDQRKQMREEADRQEAAKKVAAEKERDTARFQSYLTSFTDEDFAGKFDHGWIEVIYLNPAGESRIEAAQAFRQMKFHPMDVPINWVVRVTWRDSYSQNDKYGLFLKSLHGWRIVGTTDIGFFTTDIFGEKILVAGEYGADPGLEKRIHELLLFVSKYKSVDDYTLQTIAEFGEPVLKASKCQNGNKQLAKLRVALHFRKFETTENPWETILERDLH